MRVQIRRIAPDEWEVLKGVRLRALAEDPDAYGRTLDEEAQHSDDLWKQRAEEGASAQNAVTFLAYMDETAVGMVGSRLDAEHPDRAHVYAMWVAPDSRRRGVGDALLERIIQWSESKGVATLELSVTEGNGTAFRLYERAGFLDTNEREPLRQGSPLSTITMRRGAP